MVLTGLEWVRGDEQPLQGSANMTWRSWEEAALDSPGTFSADLAASGFPSGDIADAVKLRDSAQADVDAAVASFWEAQPDKYIDTPPELQAEAGQVYENARRGALQRLRDWLAGRKVEVQERQRIDLKLPLFLLAAPGASGASAEFETTMARGKQVGWSIAITGTGLSGAAKVDASVSAGFTAGTNEAKLVFLPVTVTAEKLRITQGGMESMRIDLSDMAREQGLAPGVLLLTGAERPPAGALAQTYPLSGDPTGAPATYSWAYKQTKTRGLSVGIKAYGADLALDYSSTLAFSIELTFKLPSGRDYDLFRLAEGDGVLWGA